MSGDQNKGGWSSSISPMSSGSVVGKQHSGGVMSVENHSMNTESGLWGPYGSGGSVGGSGLHVPRTEREWILGLQTELKQLISAMGTVREEIKELRTAVASAETVASLHRDVEDLENRLKVLEDQRIETKQTLEKVNTLHVQINGDGSLKEGGGGLRDQLVVLITQLKTTRWVLGVVWPIVMLLVSLVIVPLVRSYFTSQKETSRQIQQRLERRERGGYDRDRYRDRYRYPMQYSGPEPYRGDLRRERQPKKSNK